MDEESILRAVQGMVFSQRHEIVEWVKYYCKERGAVLTTKTSKDNRIELKCDLGGQYKAKKQSSTNSSSRLIGCTYVIVCSRKKSVWGVRKVKGSHNHDLSLDVSGHVVARRPNKAEKEKIRKLRESGLPPKEIVSQLKKEFNNNLITTKEVYRELNNAKKELLKGKINMEALVDDSSRKRLLEDLLYNEDNIAASLIIRLKDVASNRYDTLLETEKVIKKRGRPVGSKNILRENLCSSAFKGDSAVNLIRLGMKKEQ